MKKFKTQEIKTMEGKTIVFYSFKFTEEEREDLKEALSNFQDEKVEQFIEGLELLCVTARQFIKDRNVTYRRTEKRRVIGRLKKAEKELINLIDKHSDPKYNVPIKEKKSLFDESIFSPDAVILEKERLHYLVLAASAQLHEITKLIGDEPKNPGRPKSVDATGELVSIMAQGFKNHFGQHPTGYHHSRKPGSGAFYAVVCVCVQACELPYEDPSRHIAEAIRRLYPA